MKTFIRHIGRKDTNIQYKNRLKYDETIKNNVLFNFPCPFTFVYFICFQIEIAATEMWTLWSSCL